MKRSRRMRGTRKGVRGVGRVLRSAATFALGAATGSVASLLFAPASGRVIRKRIAREARVLQRTAKKQAFQTQRMLTTQAQQAREAAAEWVAAHVPARNHNGKHLLRRRIIRHATAH